MKVATDLVKRFLGLAGRVTLAAAAWSLAVAERSLATPFLQIMQMHTPQSESRYLNNVEDGSDGNENDDTILKVLCESITRYLQFAIIENLSKKLCGLGMIRKVDAGGVQCRGRTVAHGGTSEHGHWR